MREESSVVEDDTAVLQIRGQPMSRDEQRGGWLPIAGGGMSNIALYKLPVSSSSSPSTATTTTNTSTPSSASTHTTKQTSDSACNTSLNAAGGAAVGGGGGMDASKVADHAYEYVIVGQRINDQQLVLDCTLNSKVLYHRANPTFHHWRTPDQVNEKRYGLTFQSSGDASHFERAVRQAITDLKQPVVTAETTSHQFYADCTDPAVENDTNENLIFMAMNLPLRCESESTICTSISPVSGPGQSPLDTTAPPTRAYSLSRCLHCDQLYDDRDNLPGACLDAPDRVQEVLSALTCLSCAHVVLYHCTADSEGDYSLSCATCTSAPCTSSCSSNSSSYASSPVSQTRSPRLRYPSHLHSSTSSCSSTAHPQHHAHLHRRNHAHSTPLPPPHRSKHCWKRWLVVALMSIFVPCLCCYPVLSACHRGAMGCHLYGPRHAPKVH